MITCAFAGGLGNNLFQFANIYSIHKLHNVEYFIARNFQRLSFDGRRIQDEKRFYQFHDLEIPLLFENPIVYHDEVDCDFNNMKEYKHIDITSGNHAYNKPPVLDNTIYQGYYLSYKYFKDCSLKEDIIFNKKISSLIKENHGHLFSKPTIAIHYRIGGDRKINRVQKIHKNVSLSYYKKAISSIMKKENKTKGDYNFLLFSDDIETASQVFRSNLDINFWNIPNKSNVENFIHMSMCTHNIIGNSTYSWWAAYLNKNDNKIVVAPKEEFIVGFDMPDLFPPSWLTL